MKHAFDALKSCTATRLILGSMPSEASLLAQQYYAHPRNAFWRILAELTGVAADVMYGQRVQGLLAVDIALWDVLYACERKGSLDAAIVTNTSVVNDFAAFFARQPHIKHVYFNGAKAEQLFKQHVIKNQCLPQNLTLFKLPSTSPAYASLSFERKKAMWLQALTLPIN